MSGFSFSNAGVTTAIIVIPRAIGFNYFYVLLQKLYGQKNDTNTTSPNLILALILSYALNVSIIYYLGYSFITLLTTSRLVIKINSVLKLQFIDYRAMYEHVILNCVVMFA